MNYNNSALIKALSQPENRIKYCYNFMNHEDFQMRRVALESALNYIAQCNWEEAHY